MSTPKPGTSVPPPPTPAKQLGDAIPTPAIEYRCMVCDVPITLHDILYPPCSDCGSVFCDHCVGDGHYCEDLHPSSDAEPFGALADDPEEPRNQPHGPTGKALNTDYLKNIIRDIAEENYHWGRRAGASAAIRFLRGYFLSPIKTTYDSKAIEKALDYALEHAMGVK